MGKVSSKFKKSPAQITRLSNHARKMIIVIELSLRKSLIEYGCVQINLDLSPFYFSTKMHIHRIPTKESNQDLTDGTIIDTSMHQLSARHCLSAVCIVTI